jgi:hypothetical protein
MLKPNLSKRLSTVRLLTPRILAIFGVLNRRSTRSCSWMLNFGLPSWPVNTVTKLSELRFPLSNLQVISNSCTIVINYGCTNLHVVRYVVCLGNRSFKFWWHSADTSTRILVRYWIFWILPNWIVWILPNWFFWILPNWLSPIRSNKGWILPNLTSQIRPKVNSQIHQNPKDRNGMRYTATK